jgi:hypothetical protein
MITPPCTFFLGGGWRLIIGRTDYRHFINAIGLGKVHFDILVAGAGDVLADVIGAYRHLAVAPVDQDRQLYGKGPAVVYQGIHGGTYSAAGMQYVVNEHHGLPVDIGRDIRALESRFNLSGVEVVAVEGEIQHPHGHPGLLVSFDALGQASGQGDAAGVQPDDYQVLGGLVMLDNLVSNTGEGAPDVLGIHHYFYRHKKPPASGWQEVVCVLILFASLASLAGLI